MAPQKTTTKATSIPTAVLAKPDTKTPVVQSNMDASFETHRNEAKRLGSVNADGATAKLALAIYVGSVGGYEKAFTPEKIPQLLQDMNEATALRLKRTPKPLSPASLKKDLSYFNSFYALGGMKHGPHMLERIDYLARLTGKAFLRACAMMAAAKQGELTDEELKEAALPKGKTDKKKWADEVKRVEARIEKENEKGKDRDPKKDMPAAGIAALEAYVKAIKAAFNIK